MKIHYLIVLLVPFLFSCYTDKEELLYPAVSCDDLQDISFSDDVTPILENQCFACHNTANSASLGSSIVLESYSNFKFATESLGLLAAIKHESGSPQMPKNGAKLSDCDISTIETWINEGSLDN